VSFIGRSDLENPEVRGDLTDPDAMVLVIQRAGTTPLIEVIRIGLVTAWSILRFRARGGPA
jgi:hypothetical protein